MSKSQGRSSEQNKMPGLRELYPGGGDMSSTSEQMKKIISDTVIKATKKLQEDVKIGDNCSSERREGHLWEESGHMGFP